MRTRLRTPITTRGRPLGVAVTLGGLLLPALALAGDPVSNESDVAWMLTSALLVILMAIPGLALFFGGTILHAYLASAVGEYVRAPQYTSHATAVLMSLAWPGLVAASSFKIVDLVAGPRGSEDQGREGLEPVSHVETAYD